MESQQVPDQNTINTSPKSLPSSSPSLILVQFMLQEEEIIVHSSYDLDHQRTVTHDQFFTDPIASPVIELNPHSQESWSQTRDTLINLFGRENHEEVMRRLCSRVDDILADVADDPEVFVSIPVEITRVSQRVIDYDVVFASDVVKLRDRIYSIKKIEAKEVNLLQDDDQCAICLNELVALGDHQEETSAVKLPCKHTFHDVCIVNWLRQSNVCPCCRSASCLLSDNST